MPSPFWFANPFAPCDLGSQRKSSSMNNRARGGVGRSLHTLLPGKRAYGVLRQGQSNPLIYLTRRCESWMPPLPSYVYVHVYVFASVPVSVSVSVSALVYVFVYAYVLLVFRRVPFRGPPVLG